MDLQPFNWQRWVKIVLTEQARPQANQSTEMGKRGEKQGNASPAESRAECSFLVVGRIRLSRWVRVRWVMQSSGFYFLHSGRWPQVAMRGMTWPKQGFGGLVAIPKQEGLKEKCKGTKIYAAPVMYQTLCTYCTSVLRTKPRRSHFYFYFKSMEIRKMVYETWPKFQI